MTFAASSIRHLTRISRGHGLLVSGLCLAILFFTYHSSRPSWTPFGGLGKSERDEAALDSALQEAARTALGPRNGTIIIMDAQSGRVRALANPQIAFKESLLPGSTMKPFTALAALRAGLIDEESRTVCPGRFTGLGFSLPCVHGDHLPPFSPSQAIAYSCNYYFASLGQRLGRERLIETIRPFGLGQPTGIAEAEAAGVLRPCEMGTRALVRGSEANHAADQADCEARSAVGESDRIQVTPIQWLTAYTALVNGGHLYEPRLANAAGFEKIERSNLKILDQHREIITEGMAGAVRYGTARGAKLDSLPIEILGKTGTAEPPRGFRTNGWFIGFAGPLQHGPRLDPAKIELAVLVLIPRTHGADAAAVAKPIFEAYANLTSNSRKDQSESVNSPARSEESTVKIHLVTENLTQELSLEDYVLGVMRAEGTMETEPEALKALAIAIRTFALKNRGRHAKEGYDFCSTTHCQRFVASGAGSNGRASELIIQAVRATEGQVLLDNHNQPIESYFGASCGGETANLGSLWGVTPPEYLQGVRDEYCLAGPHATWSDVIKREDLLRALHSDARTDVGNRLDQIVVSKRDETGRAEWLVLEGEHRKTVRGWDFKIIVGRVLGWNVIKSSRFEVTRAGSAFRFNGSGFGHGLGLCQEGAHEMAARGANYQRILEKYFPGTRVRKSLTAEDTEDSAEVAEQNLRVPQRDPLRPLRLTMSSEWHADVLTNSLTPARVSAKQRFLTISSDHFRVTYPSDVDRRDADQVLQTLESARNDFLHRAAAASISISGLPTLEIRLNASTGDFTARTRQPWWAAAATKGNQLELQPVAILKRRGALAKTLRHELAHAVIDTIARRPPHWLSEGFALYLAGEGAQISQYSMRDALSTDELEKRLAHPRSQQEMKGLYAQAYTTVTQMIRSEGEASVWKKLAGG
jgi:SpoIID/LytB domain protein